MRDYSEFIDPYDKNSANLFVRSEHIARYLYATGFIRKRKLDRVLDCACGNGYGSRLMAAAAKTVDAVDNHEQFIEQGRSIYVEDDDGKINYYRIDLNEGLGIFTDHSFDCIACFETLEHIEQDDMLLHEFFRVLKKGRWLLLSVPKAGFEPVGADGRPENRWHLRLYTPEHLRFQLENSGFVVEKILGQPYINILRANAENYKRDTGLSNESMESYFVQTQESIRFFASIWGWPTRHADEKSNIVIMVCKKV